MGQLAGHLVVGAAALLAFASGFCIWRAVHASMRARRHRASLESGSASGASAKAASVNGRVVAYMESLTRDLALRRGMRLAPKGDAFAKPADDRIALAGLEGKVSPEAVREAKVRLCVLGCAAGASVGLLFSGAMALVLGTAGAFLGFRAPSQALQTAIMLRAHETERHLPEMLDVVALGMRSGLSFDTSLRIYAEHFDTVLAGELENARVQWSSGLVRRDEALRKLASTYDSVVFGRVVETIIRSIKYGSSMVQSLENDAREARGAYRAEREERIAKAPVKMMIPTGVLILPAMLVMVLGPVLLELAGGGF